MGRRYAFLSKYFEGKSLERGGDVQLQLRPVATPHAW
jgi:hypothetical protein